MPTDPRMPDAIYVVLVRVNGDAVVPRTPLNSAMQLGYAEGWIKKHLENVLPAGSPLEIRSVHEASA